MGLLTSLFFYALLTQASMGVPTVRRAMLNATSLKNCQQWIKMLRLPKVQLIEGQEHTQNEGQFPAAVADIHNLKTDSTVVIVSCRVSCAYVLACLIQMARFRHSRNVKNIQVCR
jgi:hypothetical protein